MRNIFYLLIHAYIENITFLPNSFIMTVHFKYKNTLELLKIECHKLYIQSPPMP